MTHEELVEKVARAMCLANKHNPDAYIYDVLSPEASQRPDWTFYEEEATAAIATIREALLYRTRLTGSPGIAEWLGASPLSLKEDRA